MLRTREPPEIHHSLAGLRERGSLILRVAYVRLRFLFVLMAGFLIVGNWRVLRNYWDTLTTPSTYQPVTGSVSQEFEYFCPMCPGAVSVWPTKCSVCNMPLVRRKRGDAQQLPDGVLARMQLSPYRIHLAGIKTTLVDYQPLVREVVARAVVTQPADDANHSRQAAETIAANDVDALIVAEIDQRDVKFVSLDAPALVVPEVDMAGMTHDGRVSHINHEVSGQMRRVKVEVVAADPRHELWRGMQVNVRFRRPIAELEPFCSQPADPPPLAEGEQRILYTCHEHPNILRTKRERCPQDDNLLMYRPLADLERVTWWCPMHPEVTASEPGHECQACNGMQLLPRIVQYRPAGQVLAVPETAIIDMGERRVVFVEQMPGMFDAVEVEIGPRCDGHYPVIRGLAPRQRVAATGAFLLDAETRLNPSVAAGYFGASLSTSSPASQAATSVATSEPPSANDAAIRVALDKLSPAERTSAERQKRCPITRMALGSMGIPVKIEIRGQTVWLCCASCEAEASKDPEKTIEKLKQQP
jgi:membrane fusion protein, copper/silver efflux system